MLLLEYPADNKQVQRPRLFGGQRHKTLCDETSRNLSQKVKYSSWKILSVRPKSSSEENDRKLQPDGAEYSSAAGWGCLPGAEVFLLPLHVELVASRFDRLPIKKQKNNGTVGII